MHENDDLFEPDLDTLDRADLAELDGPAHTVAGVLDEWRHRLHGITSGQHGAGLFLDLLAAEGWRVERIQVPELSSLLPTPSGPQQITDPDFPDLVGVVGGPLIPCKVVEFTATTAPTTRVEGAGDLDAHYEQAQRYVIRYEPKPIEITYMAGVSDEEIERAKQAVIETATELLNERAAVEVTTSEPDAALYFTCQNRHPLAVRTTTVNENGERRGVHHALACPACEADGITEVRLPDLDDEAAGDD